MEVETAALARAIHVLALVHWIGGVAIVTTIVLPAARKLPDASAAIGIRKLRAAIFRSGPNFDSTRRLVRLVYALRIRRLGPL